jgi:MFS family permease
VLSRRAYAQEDIGQIIMLYSAGVLISSTYISALVDRLGKTGGVLFIGAVLSGVAMIMIGLVGWREIADSRVETTLMLIGGMVLLGLAHGCINAPVMTHVGNTPAAEILGRSSATSVYRLVERLGHMAGPILVGWLLAARGDSPTVISILGVAMLVFGLIFALRLSFGGAPVRVAEEPR